MKPEAETEDRRPRRGPRPGGPSDRRGPPRGDRAPRVAGAPADGSDKPAVTGAEAPKTPPAVKRVRKVVPPAGGGAKGE
jgi:small subunit ribosomal protein S3